MTSVSHVQQVAKGKMAVAPVNWLPGSISAALPFFAVVDPNAGKLFLRADDPNIYGIAPVGVQQNPTIIKNGVQKAGNKGCNFFTAPWCIPNSTARDVGRRVLIRDIDTSIFSYITSLYTLIGNGATLSDWRLEQQGYAKVYQLIQGSQYVDVGGDIYFGAQTNVPSAINGVPELTAVPQNLITDDFEFNGTPVTAYQMPYNTFYAIDTPIVLSAIDTHNPAYPRLYFTLLNNAFVLNNINYPN